MAHYVTCKYCGIKFNRDKVSCVQIGATRYAHPECVEKHEANKTQEEKDKEKLEQYIKKLFNVNKIPLKIVLQIDQYKKEHNYSYSGMLRTLTYFYEIKGNSIEKSNGGIGIIPWIYQEAYNYYYNQWLLSQKNNNKDIKSYIPKVKEIKIKPPKREPKKKKIFTFLDEEEIEDSAQ